MFHAVHALALILLCLSGSATAGDIFFGLARSENRLILTNQGDSIAYYPQVLQLQTDGQWKALDYPPGLQQPAQLKPGTPLELLWSPLPGSGPVANTAPILVRFFDQAGAGIGQLSFFNRPPETTERLEIGYKGTTLQVQPPLPASRTKATWLLWGQEEGIAPLATSTMDFKHRQPPAPRLDWQNVKEAQRFEPGRGRPLVVLLHETADGPLLQTVASQLLRGREQRALWLRQSDALLHTGLATGIAALLVLSLGRIQRWKRKHPA